MRLLLAGLSLTALSAAGHGWQPALPVPATAPAASAPWYVTLTGTGGVSIVNGFTGTTRATVTPPDHGHVDGVAAARDDRTFVLYTSDRFYELRLTPAGKPAWLAVVAGAPPPGGTPFAVSPDARFAAYPSGTGITVVSLLTGNTRFWTTGTDDNASSVSWAGDRFLAFQLQPLTRRGQSAAGVRLLDTSATTRSAIAASRPVITARTLPAGLRGLFNPVITPDGATVIAAAWTGPQGSLTAEVAAFSARTGRLTAVLLPPAGMPGHGFPCTLVWTDPSGSHLTATCGVSGIVNGSRFTQADLHLPGTSGTTLSPFLAW